MLIYRQNKLVSVSDVDWRFETVDHKLSGVLRSIKKANKYLLLFLRRMVYTESDVGGVVGKCQHMANNIIVMNWVLIVFTEEPALFAHLDCGLLAVLVRCFLNEMGQC